MQNKIQPKLIVAGKYTQQFIVRMRDPKFAGMMLFLVVVLLISWSGVKSIQSNYELQKQIAALEQQNDLQKLRNTNLDLENQYYNTNSYQDLQARLNLGLAAPGEKEILVPKDVALSYTVDLPKPEVTTRPKDKQSGSQRNFESWVNFFLHRQNITN
ncbi:MAG TPA: septum formation initiator family protein [Candidatus Microsaccharimonas sp.]|nr:septum formation initiator family protein [Candidatus Microsaccharimonas sp.]